MSEDWYIAGVIASIFAFVILLVGGIVLVGSRVSKHYDRIACTSFGEQSSRQVRFVTYNFWAWDCLTPTADGKWISTANLREFGEQP